MPKLDTFELTVKTGERGRNDVPRYTINGFPLDFDEVSGGVGSGETLQAKGRPQSFPHTLTLIGPDEGEWDIESMTMTYHCAGDDPYTLRFGSFTVDEESEVNIWHNRPAPVFDV